MTDDEGLNPIPNLVGDGGKIVLVVLDGLGGFASADSSSEVTAAKTPTLDDIAKSGSSGLHIPVAPGVTPGSGAGHLALFGYDPLRYEIGRGALSAAGIGITLDHGDVAARVNFCRSAEDGTVEDRRAGRIATEESSRLAELLNGKIDVGIEVAIHPEREHRAVLILKGEGLSPRVHDTDPGRTGVAAKQPEPADPADPASVRTAKIVAQVVEQAREILSGEEANSLLLRGFEGKVDIPGFPERYRLKARGIASYPMYLGIAGILGMDVTQVASLDDAPGVVEETWEDTDYFFIHHKGPDAAGEDGDFDAKVEAIEAADALIGELLKGAPSVACITGDHSTPSQLRGHSWHPVPFVMGGPSVGMDNVEAFNEVEARAGAFGTIAGKDLMGLMLAAARRLSKFGP